jgi:hypothetical protein
LQGAWQSHGFKALTEHGSTHENLPVAQQGCSLKPLIENCRNMQLRRVLGKGIHSMVGDHWVDLPFGSTTKSNHRLQNVASTVLELLTESRL